MQPSRFLRAGMPAILVAAVAACASPAPSPSQGTPSPSAEASPWKAEGPFPQVRYYVIADT